MALGGSKCRFDRSAVHTDSARLESVRTLSLGFGLQTPPFGGTSCLTVCLRRSSQYTLSRDALSPKNLEISPNFPDFELRSLERSKKSGISWFPHGKLRNGTESL